MRRAHLRSLFLYEHQPFVICSCRADRGGQNADVVPTLAPPTDKEVRNAVFQLDYLRHQRFSPYWPTLGARTLKPTASAAGSKPTASGVEPADATHNKASLKQVKMQKEVFPQDVWRAYMDGETKRALRAARRQARTKIDWAVFEAAGAGEGAEGAVEGAGVSDDDVGDYEDEVDDDYNQNYFDPGDDDDDGGDDGGDEGGGTFE